ncbi:MAG: cytochrome c, class I [Pseudomonadota bacterium]
MALRRLSRIVFAAGLLAAAPSFADDARAKNNYLIHCQGCHLPNAIGMQGKVPPMNDFVGFFMHSQQGREYLIRVPGVAGSTLSDAHLAELMNWLLITHSNPQMPEKVRLFSAGEVGKLRRSPLFDPEKRRIEVLRSLAKEEPGLAHAIEEGLSD